jgi:ribulose-phosphate 3-epimerase
MKMKIAPSVMCADLMELGNDLRELTEAGVEYFHWDIMDGEFVPNFSMSPDIIKAARQVTDVLFDVHLMIQQPERYVQLFAEAGADIIAVHVEATTHLHRTLQRIKETGAKAAVALNPATPLSTIEYILEDVDMVVIMTVNPGFAGQKLIPATLEKIMQLRRILDNKGVTNIDIQVDGNVSFENAVKMKSNGANVFVAGTSSVFKKGLTLKEGVAKMREYLAE